MTEERRGLIGSRLAGSSLAVSTAGDFLSNVFSMGLIRLGLTLLLPFVLIKAQEHSSSQTLFRADSTQNIIQVPEDFCELDARADCAPGQCLRYDPLKFVHSSSIATYYVPVPNVKFGHMITAVLSLLWLKLELGFDVFLEKRVHKTLAKVFEDLPQSISVLEDKLCLFKQYPWDKLEGTNDILDMLQKAGKASKGHAVQIINMDRAPVNTAQQNSENSGRIRKLYQKYRPPTLKALKFKAEVADKANVILHDAARKVRQRRRKSDRDEVTFVGIHARRTDYLDYRDKYLGEENLQEDYFVDAVEYFREEYDLPVFIFVSDDMKWARRHVRPAIAAAGASGLDDGEKGDQDVFFAGCGGDNPDFECSARDFALLSACNHSVTTHGAFGHWASYLAGGEVYTEYGVLIPDAHT